MTDDEPPHPSRAIIESVKAGLRLSRSPIAREWAETGQRFRESPHFQEMQKFSRLWRAAYEQAQYELDYEVGVGLGDKVVLFFADDQKRMSVRLSESGNDLEKGRLSASSPLGRAILGAEEGDEVEFPLENGRQRKVLIESVEKGAPLAPISADAGNGLGDAAAVA